jgi:hypothetical protein
MLLDFFPDGRQPVGEGDDVLVLRAFPHLARERVIPVLLAALRVAPGRRNVAVCERAYPDIRPGRPDRERLNSLQHIIFSEPGAIDARVGSLSRLLPAYTRPGIGDVSQTCGLSGVPRAMIVSMLSGGPFRPQTVRKGNQFRDGWAARQWSGIFLSLRCRTRGNQR